MDNEPEHFENEIDDLKRELEHFQREKERVRDIIGGIGGMPKFRTKLIETLFIIAIVGSGVLAVIVAEKWRIWILEFAIMALSAKIIFMMRCQMKINHFKFWILSSIEWRLNELTKLVKEALKRD